MEAITDFSQVVAQEYQRRKDKNKSYSIRAFARDLGVSQSSASLLIRGKMNLSKKRAEEIAKALRLSPEEQLYFTELVLAQNAKTQKEREVALANSCQYNTSFNTMTMEQFKTLTSFYTLPVMELVRIHKEAATPSFLAKSLATSEDIIEEVLTTLIEHGHIKEGRVISDFLILPDGPREDSIRQFHQVVLSKAKEAVVNLEKNERNISCAIMRMRKEDFDWAVTELRHFRRKLAARLEQGTGHDEVYTLATQFFRLDKDVNEADSFLGPSTQR